MIFFCVGEPLDDAEVPQTVRQTFPSIYMKDTLIGPAPAIQSAAPTPASELVQQTLYQMVGSTLSHQSESLATNEVDKKRKRVIPTLITESQIQPPIESISGVQLAFTTTDGAGTSDPNSIKVKKRVAPILLSPSQEHPL